MTRGLVLDPASLPALDRLPRTGIDRVVVLFQASPDRMADLARRWPQARILEVAPSCDGPWQVAAQADLDLLEADEPRLHGVPLLDCFRAAWREELTHRRALQTGLDGVETAVLPAASPWTRLLRAVESRGGIGRVEEVATGAPGPARRSLGARLRHAGARGLALALAARVDPAGLRRARLRPTPRVTPSRSVLVSSYVNATRAALEALEILGGEPAVHVRTGPGALRGCEPPASVRSMSLASVIALDRRGARRDVATACSVVAEHLARLPSEDAWAGWQDRDSTPFRRALLTVLLPEVAASVGSLQLLAAAVRAERFVVGDEFSFVDRAALHSARARGLATVSRQHGILDSHYRRERVLADLHLAWDTATVSWLADHGALRAEGAARAAPRRAVRAVPRTGKARDIVVFLQPLEMIGVPTGDWMREALVPLARVAAAEDVVVVAKLHPLQVRAAIEEFVPREARKRLRLVADPSARELLATCGVAVTLDSSVAVDCRDAGVPCLSTAWYQGTYAGDLARLGWVVPCASPTDLERAARAALAPGHGGTADEGS